MRASRGAVAIFLRVSTAPHNVAIAMVFLVLGGVVALTVAPYELGTIRLAGVSLLWWYGVIAAPLLTVTITIAALLRPGLRHTPTPDSPSVPASE
jgi:hypothetical protein